MQCGEADIVLSGSFMVGHSALYEWLSIFMVCVCVCELVFREFLARMVYLYYISCLRYTIPVGNPRFVWEGKRQGQAIVEVSMCQNCLWGINKGDRQ